MKTVKWIIAGLAGGFAAGNALIATKHPMDSEFWFLFAGGVVITLAGMGVNKGIDKTQGE